MASKLALLVASVLLVLAAFEAAIRLGLVEPSSYVVSDAWWREHWLRDREGGNPREFVELDPRLGWIPAAGLDGVEYHGVEVSTNAAHMRGRQEPADPGTVGTRVVAVGDSYTFGECVGDEETWPAAVEQRLPDTEVLNLGVMGYGQDQALLRLERDGLSYRPDFVVFGYHFSNVRRNVLSFRDYAKPRFRLSDQGLELENVPVPPPSAYEQLWPPRLWNFVEMFFDARRNQELAFRRRKRALSDAILLRMARSAEAAGARMLVVFLPHPPHLEKEGRFGYAPLADFCERHEPERLRCVDPVPRLRTVLTTPEEVREAFACHYAPRVQRAVGAAVAEALRAEAPGRFHGGDGAEAVSGRDSAPSSRGPSSSSR